MTHGCAAISRILSFCALAGFVGMLPAGVAAGPAKVAVVADESLEALPMVELLRHALVASDEVQVVDRAALGVVIDEAALVRLSNDDRTQRMEVLTRLQVADALVVLRPAQLEGEAGVTVIVCEMQRGLRLLNLDLPARSGEQGARLAAEGIVRAISTALRPDIQIWAVPPLVNRNLSYRYDHLQAAYAELLAQHLRQAPNVLLVELSEARALAQEQALGGDDVQRDLPWYVMGEFRHAGNDARVELTLDLQRGGRSVKQFVREADADEPVSAFIRRASAEMLAGAHASAPPPEALESEVLLSRARRLSTIADYDAAAILYESALLLDPGDAAAWREVALISARQRDRAIARYRHLAFQLQPADVTRAAALQAAALHLRAVEQWEQWHRRRAEWTAENYDDYSIFEYGFRMLSDASDSKDAQVRQRVMEVAAAQRQIYFDALKYDLRTGRIHDPFHQITRAADARMFTLRLEDRASRRREGLAFLAGFAASLEESETAVQVMWEIIRRVYGPAIDSDEHGHRYSRFPDELHEEVERILQTSGGAVGKAVAAMYARRVAEHRDQLRKALTGPARPNSGPGVAPVQGAPVTASLRPIAIDINPKQIREWYPLNDSFDLVQADRGRFLLVSRDGTTRELPVGSGHYMRGIWAFDGRYLWVLERDRNKGAGRLHVVDPAGDGHSSVELATYDLAMRQGCIIAPISPGRVIVAAAFKEIEDGSDHDVRTWYADIRLAPDRPLTADALADAGIAPFHTAMEAFDPYGGSKRDLSNPRQGYVPKEVAVIPQPGAKPAQAYLLINGRILLNTADHSFQMVEELWDRRSQYHVADGAVYFLRSDGKSYKAGHAKLVRRAVPSMAAEVVNPTVPYDFDSPRYPWYFSAGWHVMVSDNVAYCAQDLHSFRRLETGTAINSSKLFASSLWGYVLVNEDRVYALELPDSPPDAHPETPEAR